MNEFTTKFGFIMIDLVLVGALLQYVSKLDVNQIFNQFFMLVK